MQKFMGGMIRTEEASRKPTTGKRQRKRENRRGRLDGIRLMHIGQKLTAKNRASKKKRAKKQVYI